MMFAGNHVCWGFDNKEAPIRVLTPTPKTKLGGQGVVNRAELKSFDHTSKMFLAFAAVIACGMDGMRKGLKLP